MHWRRFFLLVVLFATLSAFAEGGSDSLTANAVQDADGNVVITWSPKFNPRNLGYNIYRRTPAGREKINEHLIAGSVFLSKRTAMPYHWKDEVRAGEFAQYEIEEVDVRGARSLRGGLLTPQFIAIVPGDGNTDTIADLGTTTGAVFVSPRGIGVPRYPVMQSTSRQREQQWDLAAQPAVKLMVAEEGWYRVTRSALAAAGFDAGDTKKLALFAEGIEQPIVVGTDAIEFYGIGIDTPSSGARAYWLVRDRGEKLRIRREKAKKSAPVPASTPLTISRVERFNYFTWLLNNGDNENFFGGVISPAGMTQELAVEHVDPNGTASISIAVQGGTYIPHEVRFDLNGHTLGTLQLMLQDRGTATFSLPSSWLVDGANTLRLTSLLGDSDLSALHWVRLTYPHRLIADNDALKVSVNGGSPVTVDGFTSAGVRALDVTDPAQPVALDVEFSGGKASFVAPSGGARTILVVGDARVLAPAQIVANRPSHWNDTDHAADLLIISARAFASAAEPLKARREAEGIETEILDVEDVYDEFGFGVRGPAAIREFLLHTRSWERAPKFTILLGDASFDPRNYLGLGTYDFVPTKLTATTEIYTATDDWFADFANNDIPQIAIGRLPARTLAQAQTMISRIVERDTAGNTRVSFVSDASDSYFGQQAQSLASLVPSDLPTTFDHAPVAADWESLLVTYIGHGSNELWAAGWFTGHAASQLTNTKKPVLAGMTCLNGYFHDLFQVSMAEALLLNPNGGAVAVWTSSSLTFPEPQMEMAHEFFRQAFAGATLGEASQRAKAATNDHDVRRSWVLFGDPSMKLR